MIMTTTITTTVMIIGIGEGIDLIMGMIAIMIGMGIGTGGGRGIDVGGDVVSGGEEREGGRLRTLFSFGIGIGREAGGAWRRMKREIRREVRMGLGLIR